MESKIGETGVFVCMCVLLLYSVKCFIFCNRVLLFHWHHKEGEISMDFTSIFNKNILLYCVYSFAHKKTQVYWIFCIEGLSVQYSLT